LVGEARIETEAQARLWREVIQHWIGCGWNPHNVVGMLEYYRQGRLPTTRRGKARADPGQEIDLACYFGLAEGGEDGDGQRS
jgi:hypothetical protein